VCELDTIISAPPAAGAFSSCRRVAILSGPFRCAAACAPSSTTRQARSANKRPLSTPTMTPLPYFFLLISLASALTAPSATPTGSRSPTRSPTASRSPTRSAAPTPLATPPPPFVDYSGAPAASYDGVLFIATSILTCVVACLLLSSMWLHFRRWQDAGALRGGSSGGGSDGWQDPHRIDPDTEEPTLPPSPPRAQGGGVNSSSPAAQPRSPSMLGMLWLATPPLQRGEKAEAEETEEEPSALRPDAAEADEAAIPQALEVVAVDPAPGLFCGAFGARQAPRAPQAGGSGPAITTAGDRGADIYNDGTLEAEAAEEADGDVRAAAAPPRIGGGAEPPPAAAQPNHRHRAPGKSAMRAAVYADF
jgi:hypothetical protein